MRAEPLFAEVERSAVISPCGTYRYALERRWSGAPAVLFVMLNPSTADGEHDDPTIRRCIGFARSWGYGALLVANLLAFRATDPDDLPAMPDAVGPENDAWLARLSRRAALVVAAWGADTITGSRAPVVEAMFAGQLHALGLTARGAPRHPLYMRGDAELVPFAPALADRAAGS